MRRSRFRNTIWFDLFCQSTDKWFSIFLIFLVPIHKSIYKVYVKKRFVVCLLVEWFRISSEKLYLYQLGAEIDLSVMQGDSRECLFGNHLASGVGQPIKGSDSRNEPVALASRSDERHAFTVNMILDEIHLSIEAGLDVFPNRHIHPEDRAF